MRIVQQPASTLPYRAASLVLTLLFVLPVWLLADRTMQFPAELKAGDLLFKVRGRMPVHSDMVIVAGDDKSVQEYGRGPWPRRILADAVRTLRRQVQIGQSLCPRCRCFHTHRLRPCAGSTG